MKKKIVDFFRKLNNFITYDPRYTPPCKHESVEQQWFIQQVRIRKCLSCGKEEDSRSNTPSGYKKLWNPKFINGEPISGIELEKMRYHKQWLDSGKKSGSTLIYRVSETPEKFITNPEFSSIKENDIITMVFSQSMFYNEKISSYEYGQIKMKLLVGKVDDEFIYCSSTDKEVTIEQGWKFRRTNGLHIDKNWGDGINFTTAFIELQKQ